MLFTRVKLVYHGRRGSKIWNCFCVNILLTGNYFTQHHRRKKTLKVKIRKFWSEIWLVIRWASGISATFFLSFFLPACLSSFLFLFFVLFLFCMFCFQALYCDIKSDQPSHRLYILNQWSNQRHRKSSTTANRFLLSSILTEIPLEDSSKYLTRTSTS